jgi:pyrroline-5-carboxylate reductase
MTSGPDTVLSRTGIAALYPADSRAAAIFEFLGLPVLRFAEETLMDAFTAAVCLPAVLVTGDEGSGEELAALARKYPELTTVFQWAPGVLPLFADEAERDAYIRRMVTPGGITDSIIHAVNDGRRMRDAFEYGIVRAREISASLG